MADKKISELTELTTPDGTEELVVNDSGVSKKVQIDNLLAGGTISNFTSTGIDDNATETAITIDSSERLLIGGSQDSTTATLQIAALSNNVNDGRIEMSCFTGTPAAPSESKDWPNPSLTIRDYENFTKLSVMSFGYSNDAVYQAGNDVWNFRLDGVGSATTSSSSTNLELFGPGDLRLGAGGTERVRILSTGGITFNGDTAAANALDDYETGTFDVTLLCDGNSVTHSCSYTKIGNMVTVDFAYTGTSSTYWSIFGASGDAVTITSNLPFTPTVNGGFACNVTRSLANGNDLCVGWRAGSAGLYLGTADQNNYQPTNNATKDSTQSNITIQGSGSYVIA